MSACYWPLSSWTWTALVREWFAARGPDSCGSTTFYYTVTLAFCCVHGRVPSAPVSVLNMIALMSCNNSIPSHPNAPASLPLCLSATVRYSILRARPRHAYGPLPLFLSRTYTYISVRHNPQSASHSSYPAIQSLRFISHRPCLRPVPRSSESYSLRTIVYTVYPRFMTGVCLPARRSGGHLSSPCSCSHLPSVFLPRFRPYMCIALHVTYTRRCFFGRSLDGSCILRRRRLDIDAMPSCDGSNVRNGSDVSWLLASGIWLHR
ncbi:hypothetical protein C8Q74DRAFT_706961 [Fomes fomentarius]|nr:hypothetical protein C8Q74DRAFT_706961 [Fomes fomentarius]